MALGLRLVKAYGGAALGVLVRLLAAVVSELGRDEIAVAVALGLVAKGMALVWAPGAWLVPGAVLLWMFLPKRVAFIERAEKGS